MNSKNFFKALGLTSAIFCFAEIRADEHPLTSIKGEFVDLKSRGHGFSGSINDYLVSGNFDSGTGASSFNALINDSWIQGSFQKIEGVIKGGMSFPFGDTVLKVNAEFKLLDMNGGRIIFLIDSKEVIVSVDAEKIEHNHFINPTFKSSLGSKELIYRLEGQSGPGYSVHLAMMITTLFQFDEQQLFLNYRKLAQTLATYSQREDSVAETIRIVGNDLAEMGLQLMTRYQAANPICTEQYNVIRSDRSRHPSMSLEEIDSRYHDGVGLPQAPRHCYLGRALWVHPFMNSLRAGEAITAEERAIIVDEFLEVAGHVVRLKKNIDAPPIP